FRHSPRHVEHHLPALRGPHTSHVVLSPRPNILQKAAVPFARCGGFSIMGAEIIPSIVLSVFLRGDPAEAVAVKNRMPSVRLRFRHEFAESGLAAEGREGLRLHPGAGALPIENN